MLYGNKKSDCTICISDTVKTGAEAIEASFLVLLTPHQNKPSYLIKNYLNTFRVISDKKKPSGLLG